MENTSLKMDLTRRKMLLKIVRVVTSKLITGNYRFPAVSEITAEDLQAHMNGEQPPLIVDTRSSEEFQGGFGHIPGSLHIPMMELVVHFPNLDSYKQKIKAMEAQLEAVMPYMDREVVTVCPGGGFSLVAAEILAESGFKDVKSLEGGADGWFFKDLPTTTE
jgi:rhodanese-related sulfurtransferase